MTHILSKSSFMRGLQCHKSLWLHKRHPKLALQAPERAARFNTGEAVGKLACELFPGGYQVAPEDWAQTDFNKLLKLTQAYIKANDAPIYEATLSAEGVFVMVDILVPTEKGWAIYEVKSSTQVKDHYHNDVAIQYYALKQAGLEITDAFVIHLNNKYWRRGALDLQCLFTIANISSEIISRQQAIPAQLTAMREILSGEMPNIDIGPHCSNPYECDFYSYCRQHIPEYSIFNIANLRADIKFSLYQQGIVSIEALPDDFELSEGQKRQVEGVKTGRHFVDQGALSGFLSRLWYPLCFLDFETWSPAVPPFDNTKPYGLIPFQYSLHILEKQGGKLRHYQYLADGEEDPRWPLIKQLIEQIPVDSCVLVYNQSFEIRVLNILAQIFPDYADAIAIICNNIRDLMMPFRKKHYYTPPMQGSYSIKYVLPALVPDMHYSGEIADGETATNAYAQLRITNDPHERDQIRHSLLDYCQLDTLAMVKILEKVREAALPTSTAIGP